MRLPIRSRKNARRTSRPAIGVERLEDRTLFSTYMVTNLADHGAGSLRQAILNANAHAGADTIDFATGVHGTVSLTTGQLNITGSTTIVGPGATKLSVSGHNTSRVFEIVGSSSVVAISGLTIGNGNPGIAAGGGLLNYGKLSLSADVVSNNVAASFQTSSKAGAGGAGLMNYGSAAIATTTFTNNHVYAHDGTFLDGGGAIYNAGSLSVSRSLLSFNTGELSPSVHPGSNPPAWGSNGGAIFDAGTMTVNDSTVYGNRANVLGGGIYIGSSGKATLINSTVTANVGGYTGGICVFDAQDVPSAARLTLGNTIVAANTDTHFDSGRSDIANNATTVSLGHNLIGIDNGSASWLASDLRGTSNGVTSHPLNPHLGALASNGGPTQTAAINTSSPAYNAGSNTLAATYGLTVDQRGFARVNHGVVDIGAYEF